MTEPVFYILDKDHRTVIGATPDEYLAWATEDGNAVATIVAQEHVGDKWISTIFLTCHLPFDMHFETAIFTQEGEAIEVFKRYATWDEAEKGHQECARKVLS